MGVQKVGGTVKIKSDLFQIKAGTFCKNKPQVIYFEAGAYIIPTEKKTSYSEDISNIEASCSEMAKRIVNESPLMEGRSVFAPDVADIRMKVNKASFFSFQWHLKIKEEYCKTAKFKDIVSELDHDVQGFLRGIVTTFNDSGFKVIKSKKERYLSEKAE